MEGYENFLHICAKSLPTQTSKLNSSGVIFGYGEWNFDVVFGIADTYVVVRIGSLDCEWE